MFACCAMQSSYAMVMLSNRTRAMQLSPVSIPSQVMPGPNSLSGTGDGDAMDLTGPLQNIMSKLEEGLGMVLGALRNYAIAYEALGGMRDQIEVAVESVGSMGEEMLHIERGGQEYQGF
jgi:hypothetical protein